MKQLTNLKLSKKKPPNFNEIQRYLKIKEAVFCYGGTIYNPYDRKITSDIEIHESVHSKQQGDYPEVWWVRYLQDKDFRLSQEIEAYGVQYTFIKKYMRGKLLDWAKDNMAKALSGKEYGNLISYGEAVSKIRNFAKSYQHKEEITLDIKTML